MNKLTPGTKVLLRGGYADDQWLAGTRGTGTLLGFQQVPGKTQPVAWIELDDKIIAYGGKYQGKFAALKLLYRDDSWETPAVTVQVCLFDDPPGEDTDWFEHRWELAVEDHAILEVA